MHQPQLPAIEIYSASIATRLALPLADTAIPAGFPSPALDYLDISIDLNRELIRNPLNTFYARVKGTSMINAGIDDGDLMIIDRTIEPRDGKIAICFIDGEFTVKRIKMDKNSCWLMPENPEFKPIQVTEANQFLVWGIVVYLVKNM